MIKVAIIGNPNVGKSSLFNSITGQSQKVANWPGKTVTCKNGVCTVRGQKVSVFDLPGAYSMQPYSDDEREAAILLRNVDFDVIIQIIDSSKIEKNLYLTFDLLKVTQKIVIALNMNDVAENSGFTIDESKLEESLGVRVVKIDARSGKNIEALLLAVVGMYNKKQTRQEGSLSRKIILDSPEERYKLIKDLLAKCVVKVNAKDNRNPLKIKNIDNYLDQIVLHPFFGIFLFFAVMYSIFNLTFVISKPFSQVIASALDLGSGLAVQFLGTQGAPEWLLNLVQYGIISGIGSVLVFLPQISIIVFLLYFLEDSGYLARVVVLFDTFLKRFGLGSRAFIPLLLGFGCNVPAIISTRIINNKVPKLLTILTIPFMSCSARFPVYILFLSVFFPGEEAQFLFFLYILGIIVGLCTAYILKRWVLKSPDQELIIELPQYHLPYLKNLINEVKTSVNHFFSRVSSIILFVSIFLWFISSLPYGIEYASEQSVAGILGKLISPIFSPLGFDTWQASLAVFNGVLAKEVVISTLATTYSVEPGELSTVLSSSFTKKSALAFMVFVLLYIPCIATLGTMCAELKDSRYPLLYSLYSLLIAYAVAFIVYQLAGFIGIK